MGGTKPELLARLSEAAPSTSGGGNDEDSGDDLASLAEAGKAEAANLISSFSEAELFGEEAVAPAPTPARTRAPSASDDDAALAAAGLSRAERLRGSSGAQDGTSPLHTYSRAGNDGSMGNLAIDESLLHGLLAQRALARQQRDYAASDRLRDELRSYGVKRNIS